MPLLLPNIQPPITRATSVTDRATSAAIRSAEEWMTMATRRLSTLVVVTGSGTLNYLPKWSPSEDELADSLVSDDGATVTVAGALSVTGASSVGNLTVTGTLAVSGTVNFASTLSVVGNTGVLGTLSVAGATALTTTLTVGTTLGVGTNATVGGTLGVTGGTTLSSTLGVTGAVTMSSTLGVTGNTTLGVFNTGNTQTLYGNISLNAGGIGTTTCFGNFSVGSGNLFTISGAAVFTPTSGVVPIAVTEPSNANGINVSSTATAQTSDIAGLQVSLTGSHNATAAVRAVYGAKITVTESRSAGANALTNYGVYVNVTTGQTNYGFYSDAGDNRFNVTSGTSTFERNVVINGNAQLGDTSADTHTLNGNLTLSNTPTAGPMKYGSANARMFIGFQTPASGSTYTPTTGTKAIRIRMVGGGGGGGGASGTAAQCAAGAGGASGVYIEKWLDLATNVGTATVTLGAAGAAGAAAAGTGGTGGDTILAFSGSTYTAKGGAGGAGMATGISLALTNGTPITAGSTAGVDFTAGGPGTFGLRLSSSVATAGNGGSNPLGYGGATNAVSAGGAGTGYGAGGGGAIATSTSNAGGAATVGIIIIEEYA